MAEPGLVAASAGLVAGTACLVSAIDRSVFERSCLDPINVLTAFAGVTGWIVLSSVLGAWLSAGIGAAGFMTAVSIARGDLELGRIADASSLLLASLGLAFAMTPYSPISPVEAVLGAVLSAGLIGLAAVLVRLRRGSPGLGGGDIILCAACGTWSGVWAVGPALIVAALLTAAGALIARMKPDAHIPFAPGLLVGYGALSLFERLV